MRREAITELHYIAPIENLESIFEKGILSHNDATQFKKADVSMQGVQDRRAHKVIPATAMGQARKIHDCTNVYFNAKNPMLSCRRKEKESICVLRLKPGLLDLPNAVVSDSNAATNDARFFKAAEGLNHLADGILYGQYWTSMTDDALTKQRNGQLRCAELLLPHAIHPSYIGGMFVTSEAVKQAVLAKFPAGCPVEVTVRPSFFFEKAVEPQIPQLGNRHFPNPIDFAPPPPASPPKERKIVALTPVATTYPPHITLVKGDLLDSKMQTLVNTVNCKGAMGKGIALAFKTRYKSMFADYKQRCDASKVIPGTPYIFEEAGKKIVNFPTKDDWKNPSRLEWITQGLAILKDELKKWGITSIAIPPLGCGNGGLDWNEVRKQIIDTFSDVPDIKVEIYEK